MPAGPHTPRVVHDWTYKDSVRFAAAAREEGVPCAARVPCRSTRRSFTLPPRTPTWLVATLVLAVIAAVAFLFPVTAWGQPTTAPTTRPAGPVPIAWWFEPPENFAELKARGCTAVLGPDAGTLTRMTAADFAARAAAAGLDVIGNYDSRPANLAAWFVPIDEPASHGKTPADLKPFVDKFLALDAASPNPRPILISLGGDQISNDDAGRTAEWYRQVVALAPPGRIIFSVDFYEANRNAARYVGLHLNAKIVSRLIGWTGGKTPVWVVAECSNQSLATNPPGVGRAPTADEMEGQVNDALGAGATGLVWFSTAQNGPAGWPTNYLPPTDPSIRVRQIAIAARLNGTPAPTAEQRVARLEAQVADLTTATNKAAADVKAVTDLLQGIRSLIPAPTTQPTR